MNRDKLLALLNQVEAGKVSVDKALKRIEMLPFEDVGFARIDHHRELRKGFPEVVFGAGKTAAQLIAIAKSLMAHKTPVLVTRVSAESSRKLSRLSRRAQVNTTAATVFIPAPGKAPAPKGNILVVCAGTSDLPVAEEALVTCRALGQRAQLLSDVGVAGLHRLLSEMETLRDARVVIVVAGMEGALPSVVGGLVGVPVIAVPTSIGYGASFNGLAALLGMLNSCAAGVTVVNIDNGFGAGYAASLINAQPVVGSS